MKKIQIYHLVEIRETLSTAFCLAIAECCNFHTLTHHGHSVYDTGEDAGGGEFPTVAK